MTHSHMPIKHFLKQIENFGANRANRDVRPDWLTAFINDTAELFEPLAGEGRVGFDCQLAEDCWVVGMYLGSTEIIGGMHDGQFRHLNFELDLQVLLSRFARVDELVLSAFPTPEDKESDRAKAFVTVAGLVGENPLRLQVFAVPPENSGPGMKQFPDGHCETV